MRIGIISDIHEDALRLSEAVTRLEKKNCDFLVCLGDMAGFDHRFYSYEGTRNLNYCLSLIRASCRLAIKGNHDLFVLKKTPEWNHIFDFPDHWYELPLSLRKSLSNGRVWNFEHDLPVTVDKGLLEWLDSLNEHFILEDNGLKMLFTHSLFPDPTGMLTWKPARQKDFEPHIEKLAEMDCRMGFSGHLHPNGVFRITDRKTVHGKFGMLDLTKDVRQVVCPCIAQGNQDNGFAILDTAEKTVESIPLRTPRHNILW